MMFTDSIHEQRKALEELVEILSRQRQVPIRIMRTILHIGQSARPLFSPELHPRFDAIWQAFERALRQARKEFQKEVQKVQQEMKATTGRGTPDGDLFAFIGFGNFWWTGEEQDTEEKEVRDEVLFRIAKRMSPKFADPDAKRALFNEAKERVKPPHILMHDEILLAALLEAHDRGACPQRIKLGRKWVKAVKGKVPMIRPLHVLDDVDYRRWLLQEAMKIAAHQVLGKLYPPPYEDALEAKLPKSDEPTLIPLEEIRYPVGRRSPYIDPEIERKKGGPFPVGPDHESIERGAALRKCLDAEASRDERDLLRLLVENDLSRTADLAAALGTTSPAIHTKWSRLRAKAKKLSSSL